MNIINHQSEIRKGLLRVLLGMPKTPQGIIGTSECILIPCGLDTIVSNGRNGLCVEHYEYTLRLARHVMAEDEEEPIEYEPDDLQ